MPAPKQRKCKFCYSDIPESRPRSVYCKDYCRVGQHKKLKKKRELAREQAVPEHVKRIKELAFADPNDSEMAALVRDVFNDHVRAEIDAHIRDNLLGMTEVLVDMAPHAIRALEDDLRSEDDYVRSRAYALWFKYVIPMQQKSSDQDEKGGNVTVVLATPFSERIAAAREDHEGEIIDMSDWLRCYVCDTTKHPSLMQLHDKRGKTERHICTSCLWKKKAKQGAIDPTSHEHPEII